MAPLFNKSWQVGFDPQLAGRGEPRGDARALEGVTGGRAVTGAEGAVRAYSELRREESVRELGGDGTRCGESEGERERLKRLRGDARELGLGRRSGVEVRLGDEKKSLAGVVDKKTGHVPIVCHASGHG